jgi:hypothetical protein
MAPKWRVIAVYQPPPKVQYHNGVKVREIAPLTAGKEWKFTVTGAPDYLEAVKAVKYSGYFCNDLWKFFGFVAERIEVRAVTLAQLIRNR